MSNDLRRKLYGDDYVDKEEKFQTALNEIELKHDKWFADRTDIISGSKPDKLHNHWITYNDGNSLRFGFHNDSEIPEYIKNECIAAFKVVYGIS
ncbi:hypothetical protein OQZ33_04310 [Pedobacter sp. MC2016-05]|uniref:hypothetical protein n=1 Tax=Pedobacter sp. MC2016-05 TaxID=2994474 RepID=UPI00224706A2|nr:hypothetical protein [Pedobacter sp. MC2016-05]MCX2473549.1 hypothetical protein [Pedobacter sp. MC2016-05]